jgi:uncharacterized protein YjbI with pentapeptide repeats
MASDMAKKFKYTLIAMAVVILTGGIWLMNNVVSYTAEQINADNSLINGKILMGRRLEGLRLADITLKNTTFRGMAIVESDFSNVTFENCTFSQAQLRRSNFENVIFKDCLMTYIGDPGLENSRTIIGGSFHNVVLDNVSMRAAKLYAMAGSLTFRNMRDFSDYGDRGTVVENGNNRQNINFRVENCEMSDLWLTNFSDNSTIYIRNSRLKEVDLGGHLCKIIYLENCILDGVDLASSQLLIVKDSTLHGVGASNIGTGKAYFVNNQYPYTVEPVNPADDELKRFALERLQYIGPRTVLDGQEVHVWGGNEQAAVKILGGNVYLYDLELMAPLFFSPGGTDGMIDSLNLRNVKIRWGYWSELKINSAIWENVEIYPSVEIEGTSPQINDFKVYNLTLPQGNPFTSESGSPASVAIQGQKYDQPFAWPEVHVPTPAELGLID